MIKIEKVRCTPDIASKWLSECNTHNRPMKPRHVQAISDAIKSGRWIENGDTIGFDVTGKLIDGQHRLSAIALSGFTVDIIVVRGLPEKAFQTKDTGARRTSSDTLSVLGEKNTKSLSSAVRFVHSYLTRQHSASLHLDNQTSVEVLKRNPGIRDSVQFIVGLNLRVVLRDSVSAGCHYFCAQKDKELADWFFTRLKDGLGIGESDPVYLLRQRLISDRSASVNARNSHVAPYVIKAWNFTRKNQKIGLLRFLSTEQFPTVE